MQNKNSGIGKASFILSVTVAILMLLTFFIIAIMEAKTPGGMDDSSFFMLSVGCFFILLLFADLVALGLGIGGIAKKECRKTFAAVGTSIAGATLLVVFLLIVLGLVAKA